MGKHILLLLLGLYLLVNSLQALTCFKCARLNSERICEKEEGCCQAKPGEKCASLLVLQDGKIQFGVQRCAITCFNGSVVNGNKTMEMNCCNDKSYCNSL
ncbi:secreted seminal-vesicle Ly-6 protein 1-like [Onychomys torridus]|uniref:secreted seminal-vesicle Ly-6 protein 1-like n=1 Tax=Onychomys torridus TaxID=38674 RepID=UPI00167FD5C1|nr:secreted seminal-vesicle Ly-6 protein 1-like [Onychomys torridus]